MFTDSLPTIRTPYFQAVAYPLCYYNHYVKSLHYPYSIVEEEALTLTVDFLNDAFEHVVDLKRELLAMEDIDEEFLREEGVKIPAEVQHECSQWPLPAVETFRVKADGSGEFCNITFPNADRPGEPYEPYAIEEWAKIVDKAKRKHGVYFGERPADAKVDALG